MTSEEYPSPVDLYRAEQRQQWTEAECDRLRAALARSEQRAVEAEAQRDAFERDYTAVGERNRELHDQLFALHATFLACEQRAGEAEARAEAMAKMLAAGCETVLDGRLDRFWAMGADAMARRVVEFTPPRAGDEEPPATATTDAGLREALIGLLRDIGLPYPASDASGIGLTDAESRAIAALDALTAAPPARRVDELREAEEERLARLREKLASLRDLSARKAIAADKRGEAGDYQTFRSQDAMRLAYGRALSWVDEIFALAPASGAGPAVTPAAQQETDRERQLREYVSVEARILRREYRGRNGYVHDAIERLERVVTFQSAGPGDDAGGGTP